MQTYVLNLSRSARLESLYYVSRVGARTNCGGFRTVLWQPPVHRADRMCALRPSRT